MITKTYFKWILVGITVGGLCFSFYYHLSNNMQYEHRTPKETPISPEEIESEESEESKSESESASSEQLLKAIIVQDKQDISKAEAEQLKKELENAGFTDCQILLSNGISGKASRQLINDYSETRSDLTILTRE